MPYGLTSAETRRVTALLREARRALSSLSCTSGDLPWQYADVQTGISRAVDTLIRAFEVLQIHDRTLLPCPQCYRPSVECLCSPSIKEGTHGATVLRSKGDIMTPYPVTLMPAETRHPELAIAWAVACIRSLANPDLTDRAVEYDATWLGRYLYHLARYVRKGDV